MGFEIQFRSWFDIGICHPKFIDELSELLKTNLSGCSAAFFKSVVQQLSFLKLLGRDVYRADSNEILKYIDDTFYSLHLKHKQFNVRFIIYIDDNDIPYFLCAFFERSGKRKTSYENYKDVFLSRLSEIKEENI